MSMTATIDLTFPWFKSCSIAVTSLVPIDSWVFALHKVESVPPYFQGQLLLTNELSKVVFATPLFL